VLFRIHHHSKSIREVFISHIRRSSRFRPQWHQFSTPLPVAHLLDASPGSSGALLQPWLQSIWPLAVEDVESASFFPIARWRAFHRYWKGLTKDVLPMNVTVSSSGNSHRMVIHTRISFHLITNRFDRTNSSS